MNNYISLYFFCEQQLCGDSYFRISTETLILSHYSFSCWNKAQCFPWRSAALSGWTVWICRCVINFLSGSVYPNSFWMNRKGLWINGKVLGINGEDCKACLLALTDAVLAVRRQVISVQTQTLEGAHAVDALAVPADLTGVNAALVDICHTHAT